MSTALAKRYDHKKLATQLRNKLRNQEAEAAQLTRRLSTLGFGAAAAGGVGYYFGTLKRKGLKEATLDTDKDPTKLGPVPIPLLIGGLAAGAGLVAGGLTKSKDMAWINELAESGGAGVISGYTFLKTYEMGLEEPKDDE